MFGSFRVHFVQMKCTWSKCSVFCSAERDCRGSFQDIVKFTSSRNIQKIACCFTCTPKFGNKVRKVGKYRKSECSRQE